MEPIFFSTESMAPAAQMIMDCFTEIRAHMKVSSLDKYTDALDEIAIIPFCVDYDDMLTCDYRESKNVGWKRREADIRLWMNFEKFVRLDKPGRMQMCKEVIIKSIEVISAKCEKKKLRFDAAQLIADIFPDSAE